MTRNSWDDKRGVKGNKRGVRATRWGLRMTRNIDDDKND
jgi:hypothetical protein